MALPGLGTFSKPSIQQTPTLKNIIGIECRTLNPKPNVVKCSTPFSEPPTRVGFIHGPHEGSFGVFVLVVIGSATYSF